jgi:antitoxin component of RelBE/YafQ-DinJ toxin-antitoxin module
MTETSTVRVDTILKNSFAEICETKYDLNLKEAFEILMNFIIKYRVNPDDLESLWIKNPKRDMANYHNFTVGFFKNLGNETSRCF